MPRRRPLQPTLKKVLEGYPAYTPPGGGRSRVALAGQHRGACRLHVAATRPLEFVLAVLGRCNGEFVDLLEPMSERATEASAEIVYEAQWQGRRLVVAHNPERVAEQTQQRLDRIHSLQQRADQLAGKLHAQDEGKVLRGRKFSDPGTKARLFHEVSDAHHQGGSALTAVHLPDR